MAIAEGTIQFAYDLVSPADGERPDPKLFRSLKAWRTLLRRLDLLGQDPERYDGYGFGNLSGRLPHSSGGFTITASQTSGNRAFKRQDLVLVSAYNFERFWVEAKGTAPPSSEALTHAMIYAADTSVNWIWHVHSPEIWTQHASLGLPTTPADVPYGSLDMVAAVADLLTDHPQRPLVFATLGHEDGIFACGATAQDTGAALMACFAQALETDGLEAATLVRMLEQDLGEPLALDLSVREPAASKVHNDSTK